MRGTHVEHFVDGDVFGIIPAYAGNTHAVVKCPAMSPGSSPRMRGTHKRCEHRNRKRRIIPAYAGNTGARTLEKVGCGDHPRVCGEHTISL